VILEGKLKGKKKGFLMIKGGFAGTFQSSIQIPSSAQDLTVRVVTKDGSTDLSSRMTAPPPTGGVITMLQVEVNLNKLALNWQAPTQPVRQGAAVGSKQ